MNDYIESICIGEIASARVQCQVLDEEKYGELLVENFPGASKLEEEENMCGTG